MSNRPILCGKCGTSSDVNAPRVVTRRSMLHAPDLVSVECLRVLDKDGFRCGHSASSDSLPAALAKFEERVEAPK